VRPPVGGRLEFTARLPLKCALVRLALHKLELGPVAPNSSSSPRRKGVSGDFSSALVPSPASFSRSQELLVFRFYKSATEEYPIGIWSHRSRHEACCSDAQETKAPQCMSR
jgi:hypothetical protein